MNLKSFKDDPLYSDALQYWINIWDSIADDIERGTFGIEIINIRIVLLDIINEYTLNKFESDNNRKVYIHLIERFLKEKHLTVYRNELLILKGKLEEKDNEGTHVVAKELSKRIAKEVFSNLLFEELLTIIKNKNFSKQDRIKITKLTKDIIIDLITSGTQIQDIKNFINDLFKTYIEEDGEEILILFKYVPERLSLSESKEYIDNLDIESRLKIFQENLTPKNYEYLYVFPVWGMIAPLTKLEVNKVLEFSLYDPDRNLIFKDYAFDESFSSTNYSSITREENTVYKSRCNAFIKINATTDNLATKIAKEKFSELIDIINYNFDNKQHIIFSDGQYFVHRMDKNHNLTALNFSNNNKESMKKYSRDFPIYCDPEKLTDLEDFSTIINSLKKRDMYVEMNSILSVIELIAKSRMESDENKLLNYWICIETLSTISKKTNENTFSFIKEAISNIYLINEQFMPIKRLYHSIDFYLNPFFHSTNKNEIPNDFLDQVGLNRNHHEESSVSIIPFYERMNELPFGIKDIQLLDMIEDTIDFYKSNKVALTQIQDKKKEVDLTIDYIYKSRNQIVHNGYVAKNIVPYLVEFAGGYAISLFQTIVSVYSSGDFDLQNHFIKEKYKRQLLEKKLSEKDFFNIQFEE